MKAGKSASGKLTKCFMVNLSIFIRLTYNGIDRGAFSGSVGNFFSKPKGRVVSPPHVDAHARHHKENWLYSRLN